MKKFDLPSGATLEVTPASVRVMFALKQAVFAAMGGPNPGFTDKERGRYAELALQASPQVDDALFKCGETALYKPASGKQFRADSSLYDNPEVMESARSDVQAIREALIDVNFGPFMKAPTSLSSASAQSEKPAQP